MMADQGTLSHHPAPEASKLPSAVALLMLFGGPTAWFVQFAIGNALAGWPCFPNEIRLPSPVTGYGWTGWAAILVILAGAIAGAGCGVLSLLYYREVQHEWSGGEATLLEGGHGRTRFVALWGMLLGFGSAIASALTLIAFLMVPRCGG